MSESEEALKIFLAQSFSKGMKCVIRPSPSMEFRPSIMRYYKIPWREDASMELDIASSDNKNT